MSFLIILFFLFPVYGGQKQGQKKGSCKDPWITVRGGDGKQRMRLSAIKREMRRINMLGQMVSLDAPNSEGEGSSYMDLLESRDTSLHTIFQEEEFLDKFYKGLAEKTDLTEEQVDALKRITEGESIESIAEDYGVSRGKIKDWMRKIARSGSMVFDEFGLSKLRKENLLRQHLTDEQKFFLRALIRETGMKDSDIQLMKQYLTQIPRRIMARERSVTSEFIEEELLRIQAKGKRVFERFGIRIKNEYGF